jgi:hypothetical protein
MDHLIADEISVRSQRDQVLLTGSLACTPNTVWREKVTQWCYDLADHLNENRDLVYVALNILDRYCAIYSEKTPIDERAYEIASMASIFLAIRIAGSGILQLTTLTSMSRRGVIVQEIITMGTDMIKTLTWDHRVVTPSEFVTAIVRLIPSTGGICETRRKKLLESCAYLTEISVCDITLSHVKASELAVSAVLNSLRSSDSINLADLKTNIKTKLGIDCDSDRIASLRARLHAVYGQCANHIRDVGPHLVKDDDESDADDECTLQDPNKIIHNVSSDDVISLEHPKRVRDVDDVCPPKRARFDLTTIE